MTSQTPHGRLACVVVLAATLTAGGPRSLGAQPLHEHPRVEEAIDLLEVWLEAQRAYEEIPGLSAAVVHDQELVWSGAYGHAHPDEEVPATPGTLYSICSISKLFTAVSVMQLRDRGLLDLDDPVSEHLPWFDIQEAHPEAGPATVEALLTHSSGLPRESAHPYWTAPDFEFPTKEEVVRDLESQETLYPARTYFQYSNLGLSLAGYIVEELSGEPYDRYVRSHVLEPLGMEDTFTEIPVEHRGGRLATGYSAITREGDRKELELFQARGIAPAAGFASSVEDLARFASWQFRLDPGHREVLDGNTLREMQRVHWVDPDFETHWGLGFSVSRQNETTFVGHGGSCPGYRSHLRLQTKEKVAAVFAANALGVSPGSYTGRMYEIVAPALRAATEEGESGEDEASDQAGLTAEELERFTGTYDASFGGEVAVLVREGSLAMLPLPTDDPLEALTELEHVEGETFRRVRDDGEPGEEIVFETDAEGQVVRMVRFSNYYPKIR